MSSASETVLIMVGSLGGAYVLVTLIGGEIRRRDYAQDDRDKEARRFRSEVREEIAVLQRKLDRALERLDR